MKIIRGDAVINKTMGQQQIKKEHNLQYLGVQVTEGNKQEHMNSRITKSNNNVSALYPILKGNHVLRR